MRINCIPVDLLADVHAFAEWRELKILPKSLLRSKNSKNGLDMNKISEHYTLNTGHGYFFYDKLSYIYKRSIQLKEELEKRGYNLGESDILVLNIPGLMNDWVPTPRDMNVSLERITQKIMMKPEWYRYKRKSMTKEDWVSFLELQKVILSEEI